MQFLAFFAISSGLLLGSIFWAADAIGPVPPLFTADDTSLHQMAGTLPSAPVTWPSREDEEEAKIASNQATGAERNVSGL